VISGTFAATGSSKKRRPWLAMVSATSGWLMSWPRPLAESVATSPAGAHDDDGASLPQPP
jgi:hypothetical protein